MVLIQVSQKIQNRYIFELKNGVCLAGTLMNSNMLQSQIREITAVKKSKLMDEDK